MFLLFVDLVAILLLYACSLTEGSEGDAAPGDALVVGELKGVETDSMYQHAQAGHSEVERVAEDEDEDERNDLDVDWQINAQRNFVEVLSYLDARQPHGKETDVGDDIT